MATAAFFTTISSLLGVVYVDGCTFKSAFLAVRTAAVLEGAMVETDV